MRFVAAALVALVALSGCGERESATPATAERFPQSVYIKMPDGTKLAADIWLPPGIESEARVPALVSITRYWRSRAFDPPMPDPDHLVHAANGAGYAAILVDARGSGASDGSRATEFSTCETRDFRHVIDWIAEQSWSNGRVATIGVSYTGNTAEHATFDRSPALRAAVPRFTDFDAYELILFPGGLRNALIASVWGQGVHALDRNHVPEGEWRSSSRPGTKLLGVHGVDADADGKLLAAAVAGHANNLDVSKLMNESEFRDDLAPAAELTDDCKHMVMPYRFVARAAASDVPTYHWGSWLDAGTAVGVLARFSYGGGSGTYVIGPWSHGADHDANLFAPAAEPVQPSVDEQYAQIFSFLAPHMLEGSKPPPAKPGLTYYTMGENVWKHTDRWPPAGVESRAWYLAADGKLGAVPSRSAGADEYTVNFEAGTGRNTRWSTQLGGLDVHYGDRRDADKLLLTYTSEPLPTATEITGQPLVKLFVSSTHADGALIAYLESVAPDGSVMMITEGELRLIHRRTSTAEPPYPRAGPYRTFERKDAQPMVPGETVEISFAMLPTSVRIPAGHSLRLAIAGHDKDAFARYPEAGTPVLRLVRSARQASAITLPVVGAR